MFVAYLIKVIQAVKYVRQAFRDGLPGNVPLERMATTASHDEELRKLK